MHSPYPQRGRKRQAAQSLHKTYRKLTERVNEATATVPVVAYRQAKSWNERRYLGRSRPVPRGRRCWAAR